MTFAWLTLQAALPASRPLFCIRPRHLGVAWPGTRLDSLVLARALRGAPGSGRESTGTPEPVVIVPVARLVVVTVGAPEIVGIVVVPRPAPHHPRAGFGRPLLAARAASLVVVVRCRGFTPPLGEVNSPLRYRTAPLPQAFTPSRSWPIRPPSCRSHPPVRRCIHIASK